MTPRALFVLAVLAAPATGLLNGCIITLADSNDIGPSGGGTQRCVARYQVGDALKVRLGAIYDATSDYRFEDGWLGPSFPGLSTCAGKDGLQSGSVVTVTLTGAASGSGGACVPWDATLQPEAVVRPEQAGGNLIPTRAGVTIALAVAEGTLAGRPLFAFRSLVTPSGDPDGTLTRAELPPLAFTRELSFSDEWDPCYDAWVATWEP